MPQLVKRIPKDVLARIRSGENRYFESFAGGAALFFHLRPKDGVISDTNDDLINVYMQLQRDVERVIRPLRRFAKRHSVEHYYELREAFNEDRADRQWEPWKRAAAFIYFNKTGFNGLYRVNRSGDLNVPIGKYENPKICDEARLRAAAGALRGMSIDLLPYARSTSRLVGPGDLVYFDPPYDPVSATASFVAYGSDGFGKTDQMLLASHASDLVWRGAHVMLSNSDTKFIRSLYKDPMWTVSRVKCGRSINSSADRRGAVNEVVIVGSLPTTKRKN